jgi:hypothetical protein
VITIKTIVINVITLLIEDKQCPFSPSLAFDQIKQKKNPELNSNKTLNLSLN